MRMDESDRLIIRDDWPNQSDRGDQKLIQSLLLYRG